ncbi:MAG: molybdopterin-binding/glycosyltransferase family 2 protein [Kiloniellales bacterium]|nr:molybdopterin-binding/glycosyltransferase family 2 protein [Kiloniellales bacterium]
MIFGETPLDQAEGAILAHALKAGSRSFKKGRILSAEDVEALREAGLGSVIAARLEAEDVHEDEAATVIAEALAGDNLSASAAFTGRCNLIAEARGLAAFDRAALDALNLVDEAVTVATLAPFDGVVPRQMVATVKIIPFAVPRPVLQRCLELAAAARVGVAPFRDRRVGLVQTILPGGKASLLEKTKAAVDARLAGLDCAPSREHRCRHDAAEIAAALGALKAEGCDLLLVSGASAIVDRRDVVPAGVVLAGGEIDHFGMPVDPGNLMLLAHDGQIPVIGLPGCARSPKLNGLDWVLQRLVAGLAVGPAEIMALGAGGLLKETGGRPLPRAEAVEETRSEVQRAPRIAAIILAAGQSRRMGPVNKLLAEIGGKPMLRRVAEAALASKAGPVIVVTGHEPEAVTGVLAGLDLQLVHNPDYAAGLSTSLQRGLGAVPVGSDGAGSDGAVVCLGDMPGLTAGAIDRLIAAFNPLEGRAICVPTWQGKRGNPLLFAQRYFAEIQAISGDVGARHLIGEYPEAVAEVPMADDAILQDIDTPDALAAFKYAG